MYIICIESLNSWVPDREEQNSLMIFTFYFYIIMNRQRGMSHLEILMAIFFIYIPSSTTRPVSVAKVKKSKVVVNVRQMSKSVNRSSLTHGYV